MNKLLLTLILTYILSIPITAQTEPSMVRFDFPEHVLADNNFEVSAVFKLNDNPSESFKLYFSKSNLVMVNSASIFYNGKRNQLKINEVSDDPLAFYLNIDSSKFKIEDNFPYQIIFNCKVSGVTKVTEELLFYKGSLDKTSDLSNSDLNSANGEIDFYKYQETAGKSLLLKNGSKFVINYLNKNDETPIYLEFWVKSLKSFKKLLNIIDVDKQDTFFTLEESDMSFLSTPFDENDIVRNDVYLPNSSWNYIGIYLKQNFNDVTLNIFINSKLANSKIILGKSIKKLLKFSFQNYTPNNDIELDRVRLTKLGNNVNTVFETKHYLSFDADSSKLIAQFNFDEKSEVTNFKKDNELYIKYQDLEFEKSTAPIFSRAPKLTVNIGSSYNSIVWYVQEYYVAKEFILEKSTNNNSFQNIYKTFADDDPLKIYYYTDDLVTSNEVAFYRLKQVNKDGSSVYSAEIKIGNKSVEEFKLKQNYPNPFNPITSIYVDVAVGSELEVNVYDLVGNSIAQLYKGYLPEGLHTFEFNGSSLPSGIYFYEAISPKAHVVKKMILAK
ncbi:MAG: T9SS type A sorting domain-containing protein [Ignavibacteriae bacterium]|nr:T9SS type A sorting domain-containing protein [Ignavibacteriota bacterium]